MTNIVSLLDIAEALHMLRHGPREWNVPGPDEIAAMTQCKHCGGAIAARNPTGACDHLYWPDNLSVEAKLANGIEQPLPTAIEALRHMRDTTQSQQQYQRAVEALRQMGVSDE